MKRFIGFVKKEFYHIFRDKRSMFILFGMPIAQIMLFGFAITNEINNVKIAILDKSKDTETQKIKLLQHTFNLRTREMLRIFRGTGNTFIMQGSEFIFPC